MNEFLMVSKYGIRLVFDLMRVVFLTKFEEVKLSSDNWARLPQSKRLLIIYPSYGQVMLSSGVPRILMPEIYLS